MKKIIRSAPGVPAEYMLIRRDHLTYLYRHQAQTHDAYMELHRKFIRASVELMQFQQERQQKELQKRRLAVRP